MDELFLVMSGVVSGPSWPGSCSRWHKLRSSGGGTLVTPPTVKDLLAASQLVFTGTVDDANASTVADLTVDDSRP